MISVRIQLIFLIISVTTLHAQRAINLPSAVSISVNDNFLSFTDQWYDSLVTEAAHARICFIIVGVSSTKWLIKTNIQLPQILSINEIYRQVVLYYAMIPDEKNREKERVNIYPYFNALNEKPYLIVRYKSEGQFDIELNKWTRIAVPAPPGHEEMRIFNQILQTSFSGVETFSGLSEDIFKQIAGLNYLSTEKVRSIYQNILLWQQAHYFLDGNSPGNDTGLKKTE